MTPDCSTCRFCVPDQVPPGFDPLDHNVGNVKAPFCSHPKVKAMCSVARTRQPCGEAGKMHEPKLTQ